MQRIWGMLCATAGALALVLMSVGAAQAGTADRPDAPASAAQDAAAR